MRGHLLKLNFLIVLGGVLGSLYFSEVVKYPPCVLCWYQRICLYPLVLIFGAAIWREDRNYKAYALPLAALGLLIAGYHNLVYYKVISEALTPCTAGISCSSKQLELFGFITIPLLSFVAFVFSTTLIILDRSFNKENL